LVGGGTLEWGHTEAAVPVEPASHLDASRFAKVCVRTRCSWPLGSTAGTSCQAAAHQRLCGFDHTLTVVFHQPRLTESRGNTPGQQVGCIPGCRRPDDPRVEVDDPNVGNQPVARGAAERAQETFETAGAQNRPGVEAQLRDLTAKPETVKLEFCIKFTAGADALIAKPSVEGNAKVTLTWKPQ
jgi:hypothetical protein